MNYIARFITEHKKPVVVTFLITAVICTILSFMVTVNQNMLDYLPKDAESTIAIKIMEDEFGGSISNASVMVSDVSIAEASEYKKQIKELEGVTDVMWLDDVINIKEPLEMADIDTVESYYKDGAALFSVTIENDYETSAVKAIRELIGDHNSLSGDAVDTAASNETGNSEGSGAMMILFPLIVLILYLTTTSWIEPILYIATIGIAAMINMGLTAFAGTISSFAQTVTPILQLAVSLDYMIFLMHSFEKHHQTTSDVKIAMQQAIKTSFPAIAASAATTLFGFLALIFMKFRIGADLGLNLAKAVLISYMSVMVFLPALTLCCYKLIEKTRHKKIIPEFNGIGKILLKTRIPALMLVMLIVVPCYLAQNRTNFIYGTGEVDTSTRIGSDKFKIEEMFGTSNAMVVLVPKGDIVKEEALCSDLEKIDHINSVIAYVTTVGASIPSEYLDENITSNFYSENYTRIILYMDTENEGEEAFATVKAVRNKTAEYYDTSYSCGQSANLYDMKNIISKDNSVVNYIALGAIALVLFVTFKSALLPVLLLFVIESAIWINLSVPYFQGVSLVYIGYLVINTVQLGATIDYAILMTESYMRNRKIMDKKAAMKETLGKNFMSILTSALILASAGFGLYFTSTNSAVTALGLLLARGTILSFMLVACLLPALVLIFDNAIRKTTIHAEFYEDNSDSNIEDCLGTDYVLEER